MNQLKSGRLIVLAMLVSLAVGCKQRKFVPVSGVVTFQGKPVANANVAFEPENEGPTSVGTTASDGTFSLSVARERDKPGAKVGVHRVSISAFEEPPPDKNVDPKLGSLVMATGSESKVKNLLPDRYANVGTSGLTFEVNARGDNFAEFELTK